MDFRHVYMSFGMKLFIYTHTHAYTHAYIHIYYIHTHMGFPGGSVVKNLPALHLHVFIYTHTYICTLLGSQHMLRDK